LPAAQAPAEAPDQINDVHNTGHAVNTANQDNSVTGKKKKKNPKPKYNSKDESSSKHKKKKGLGKLNPF
jgi:outer membrane protein assembly factor BamD